MGYEYTSGDSEEGVEGVAAVGAAAVGTGIGAAEAEPDGGDGGGIGAKPCELAIGGAAGGASE